MLRCSDFWFFMRQWLQLWKRQKALGFLLFSGCSFWSERGKFCWFTFYNHDIYIYIYIYIYHIYLSNYTYIKNRNLEKTGNLKLSDVLRRYRKRPVVCKRFMWGKCQLLWVAIKEKLPCWKRAVTCVKLIWGKCQLL